MSRGLLPKLGRVRALYRLIGDVRSMSAANPQAQRRALVDGACRLFNADQGFLTEFEDFVPPRAPREVCTVMGTQVDERVVRFTDEWYAENAVDRDAMGLALYESAAVAGPRAIAWSDVRRTKRPEQYDAFHDIVEQLRLGDILDPMSLDARGHMIALSLHRIGPHARPFDASEKALARLLAKELSWLHRTGRLSVTDLTGQPLPPRLAELLDHLLGENAVKQIADDMSLSIHTVRDYCDALYKRLGVRSREQLMARYLRRA